MCVCVVANDKKGKTRKKERNHGSVQGRGIQKVQCTWYLKIVSIDFIVQLHLNKNKLQISDLHWPFTNINRVMNEMLGFTRVFRVLAAHKKIIFGHNFLMDLMIIYDKFYKPLPGA